ncbi:MAG: hypothetical protein GXX96_28210 [Planctomycetaceae bacterium]|nr:hypothetical protein [Planctomycetaceae bacterium]
MTSIRFIGDVPLWLGALVALGAAAAAWLYYRREKHDLPPRLRICLPMLRAAAVLLAVLVLTGPVLHHRRVEGQLGRVVVFLDASTSMAVRDPQMPEARKLLVAEGQGMLPSGHADAAAAAAVARVDETTRWQRAENSLLHPDRGLLQHLASTHDVELIALNGTEGESLWDRLSSEEPPVSLKASPAGPLTDLASAISRRMGDRPAGGQTNSPQDSAGRTAVVLLSDGRHNSGPSPVETARILASQSIPVHTVGYGAEREPPDLALLDVEHPETVFQKDRVRGTLLIKDQMPAGQSFVAQIGLDDEILWQEQLTTQDVQLRRVEFDFSIDELVESLRSRFDPEVKHHAVPLTLRAVLVPVDGETETSNNEAEMRLAAITQSYRVLIVDGRSRWETRYLRNVFDRDEQWDVNTILVGPGTDQQTLPRGDAPDRFPADRGALFQYDLIVLGDVPQDVFNENEPQWIREFVELRGGGLVFIDGSRGHLQFREVHPLAPLLPVTRLDGAATSTPAQLRLTPTGSNRNALMLAPTKADNERLWQELPPPRVMVSAEALPGTETLVEAVVGEQTLPVMVTRSFGAGRVFYSATDETWRWRYKAADTYHQRFWNQVAQWVMPRPFTVSDDYVSLDAGPPTYAAGEAADIRVRLRGVDGRPVTDATVDALLWQDGRIVSTVTLAPDDNQSGIYRGRTGPLAEGQYEVSVRASGFSNDALRARTGFLVQPPKSRERELVSCNDELLEEIARSSGGTFMREEQAGELADLLIPLSSGRIIESDTLLWQSYWWFAAIVLLLSIEWLLRKRAGLL